MSQKSGPGWVRGTGRRDCPVGYPVKGNEPSNVYYEPGDPGYPQVIPEMCFEDGKVAEKVGFTRTGAAVGAAAVVEEVGFLRSTGGRTCPDGYPIKGNEPSNVYYRPEDPGYAQVVPEVCFADVSEAEKAGFTRVKIEAAKKTEPVAHVRKEEVAAAGAAVAGAAAVKAADTVKAADKVAEPVKVAEPARVAAPPPPPPPPPPPAPVAEASGGGWMKWLLPLLALGALAAGIWYFTRDDDKKDETPTAAATVAATVEAEAAGTVEAVATDVVEVEGTVEAAGVEGTVEVVATEAMGTVEAAGVEGTVEAGIADVEGTVEAGVADVEGTVEAGVDAAAGTAEVVATSGAGTVEAGVDAVTTGVAEGEATVEGAAGAAATSVGTEAAGVEGTVEVAATGAASPVASPVAGIVLIAKDIAYDPTAITIKASDLPVTITLDNVGAAEHDFKIDALDIEVRAAPGTKAEIVIPAGTAPGEYQFYCSIPGHKEAGMVGTLTIEA